MINEIIEKFKQAEKSKTFPLSEWHRKDLFESLIKDFIIGLGYNPDQFDYDDLRGVVEIHLKNGLKVKIYLSSLQENQRFLSNKLSAPIDTIPNPETGKQEYEITVVTNFYTWFFYFDGKEIYATTIDRLANEYELVRSLLSREAIESGKFKEVARKLLYKDDNEPLRRELNVLREKIANKILQEKTNLQYIKNPDGTFNNEILNEITTRWITRFLALKLAEDSGISFNFTLRDIRQSFRLDNKIAKPVPGAKVKEETLSNAIRALMSEFERRYNGGIFMYEEGVDYITVPDSAFFDLLDFATSWAFTIEDARIIGFVYERFLGQEIVVEERKGTPEAVLKDIGEARGRRKAAGIYYTPKYIVDYIVENTLGEILKEKRNEIDKAVKNLEIDKFKEVLKEVKSLHVLDPACGSGSFLIKVLAEFRNFYDDAKNKAEELEKKIDALKREKTKGQMLFTDDKEINELLKKYSELEKEIEELKFSGVFALRNNIYGVDIDPKAIDIAAFTLMVQVYDELKDGARCPTMINENLKIGNSLVSAISPGKRNGFKSRDELKGFKDDISNLIALREIEKRIDLLDEVELKKLIEENFEDIVDVYISIKEKYPNAIPTPQQKLLDEWHKKAKKEPIEKTFDILIHQTGLARIFLKEAYFDRLEKIKEKIEFEINKPLIRYFNSEKRVLKDKELEEILSDDKRVKEELRFVKDRATEISKFQPPKVFNWELEFPEVFFNEDGTLKENPGFDCVVGNPPWGRIKQFPEKVEKALLGEYLGNVYTLQVGNFNLYKLFLEQSYLLLRKSGFFSMIFPTSFLGENDSRLLRQEIFQSAKITKILEFPESTEVFGRENTQDVTVLCYKKESIENDYIFKIATNIGKESLPNLNKITLLSIKKSEIEEFSDTYQIPIFQNPQQEWKILKKISQIPPFKGDDKNPQVGEVGEGHLHETFDKEFLSEKSTGDLVIKGIHLDRYYVNLDPNGPQPRWVKKKEFLRKKPVASQIINNYTAIGRNTQNKAIRPRLRFVALPNGYVLTNAIKYFIPTDLNLDTRYVIGLLNSALLNWRFELFSTQNNIRNYEIESLPIVRATPNQQAPIISLVDAIIQKKKEYHSISQNIEDYIDFSKANVINLDEFLKMATRDFEVLSSIKVKTDNFDALRVRIEENFAILEYGIKRKIEEYEEIDEEEEVEVKGKYIIDWSSAGKGEIKDIEAIEFLSKTLENKKDFSKAKQKSIWQKIAEVKVPEFNKLVREGFLKFKSAMQKAKELDEEIIKIDRAIDRLVYDLYGLTEEEIQVVEKSVWGDKFEEMYSKLPSKESALKLAEVLKK
jgi:Alw26I/Eco31I/Esp3I family type II restriction m6 adenine DNA methyltransferase